MRAAIWMSHAQKVGALVHGPGLQAADLVDEGALAFFFERGQLGLFILFFFLLINHSFEHIRAASSRSRSVARLLLMISARPLILIACSPNSTDVGRERRPSNDLMPCRRHMKSNCKPLSSFTTRNKSEQGNTVGE
jgi:hypothetical protein